MACDERRSKYLLDKAKVLGTDVSNATRARPAAGQWQVSLGFKGDGQKKWTDLTSEAFNNAGRPVRGDRAQQDGNCPVAVVLDNTVVSAPVIQGVITGDAQITGSFTKQQASSWPAS